MSGVRLLAALVRARKPAGARTAFRAELLATVFLIYVGIRGVNVGVLLWPAAAAHLILAIQLARSWMGLRGGRITGEAEKPGARF